MSRRIITMLIVSLFFLSALSTVIATTVKTNDKNELRIINTEGNKLISKDNPLDDDTNPKITRNSEGIIVITYEKNLNNNSITNPIIFSNDNGENWNLKFDVSSKIFNLTGITRSPDIAYNSNLDVFYYASIDPDAEMYNNVMGFIPGDIINTEEMLMYAISACGDDYLETAVTTTENFFLSANIRDGHSQNQYLEIAYFTYPDFESPPVMGGLYPDGESIHKTSPASNIEMDAGNRIYIVAESGVEDGPKITIKSTSANEELLTNGELQNGMDKYADIEQWPGEYIDNGTDPDVSVFGNKVYVVYTQNDTVKCSYSTAESGYDPMFNWYVSNVATGAGYPAVYVIRDKVLCAYVKNGDIYEVLSEDGGATWGIASKLNEVDGTVAAEPGSLDISVAGVVWTDTRNAAKDIYYAKGLIDNNPPNSPTINGPANGSTRTKYEYIVSSTDPDDDYVYYTVDWDDESVEEWIGPHDSGEEITLEHSWNSLGSYNIKVKAIDVWEAQSDWATILVSMPKNKQLINRPILNFLEQHPIPCQLLQRFLTL